MRGLGGIGAGETGTTSRSFPLTEVIGESMEAEGRAGSGRSFLDFTGTVGFDVDADGAAWFLVPDEGPGGVGRSFFAGVANARMSSSSMLSDFFLFPGIELAAGLSFSLTERWRCSFFSRSIASTSWRISCEPSSTYGGGGASKIRFVGESESFGFRLGGFVCWGRSGFLFCDPTFSLIKGREEEATGGVALECRGMAGVGKCVGG